MSTPGQVLSSTSEASDETLSCRQPVVDGKLPEDSIVSARHEPRARAPASCPATLCSWGKDQSPPASIWPQTTWTLLPLFCERQALSLLSVPQIHQVSAASGLGRWSLLRHPALKDASQSPQARPVPSSRHSVVPHLYQLFSQLSGNSTLGNCLFTTESSWVCLAQDCSPRVCPRARPQ